MDSMAPRRRPSQSGEERAIVRLAVTLAVTLPLLGGADLAAQPVIHDAEIVIWGCVPPGGKHPQNTVPFTGISATVTPDAPAILDAFPAEWQGKPRIRVGLKPRPPGLRFRFAAPTDAGGVNPYGRPPERLLFDPPDVVWNPPVRVDSILVTWAPVEAHPGPGPASFEAGCGFFVGAEQTVMVFADATINLVALYAAPDDTVEVWGDEVGISDVHIEDAEMTGPIAIEPATWGRIKTVRH